MVSQPALISDKKEREIFQVSEFNDFINQLISIREFVIEGEISEINISQNKWVFITLKDPKTEEVLNVFSIVYQIRAYLDLLQVGTLVQVRGYPKLRGKSGRFSLNAQEIIPVGNGKLQQAFLQLKAKLESEGLFDQSRKRPLPDYPRAVFLLTAANSRAYSDFIKIAKERGFGKVKIYFIPISVQGSQAVSSILAGFNLVRKYHRQADLAVITRGGGSLEDLIAFNQEEVVRAAYGLPIPLVSAIGHEADVSLIDYIADVRASTPTNAAEVVFTSLNETQQQLEILTNSLKYQISNKIKSQAHHLNLLQSSLVSSFSQPLSNLKQIENKLHSLSSYYLQKVKLAENNLNNSSYQLINRQKNIYQKSALEYNRAVQVLNSINPQSILSRGYSITINSQGQIIKNAGQIRLGQMIKTRLAKGWFGSKVKEIG